MSYRSKQVHEPPKAMTRYGVTGLEWVNSLRPREAHICAPNLPIIGSDNGLSPGQRQAVTWTNAGLLLIRHLGTNFGEIIIGIQTFSFKKMHLKMSSAKWRPFCLGLNVLNSGWSLTCGARLIGFAETMATQSDLLHMWIYHNVLFCVEREKHFFHQRFQ